MNNGDDNNREAKVRAQRRLEAIAQLGSAPAFTGYYTQRRADLLKEAFAAMMDAATPQALWDARIVYQERVSAAALLENDETAARKIIGVNTDAGDLEATTHCV